MIQAVQGINEAGLDIIQNAEGLDLQLYNDPANNASIGYGHLVHLGPICGDPSEAPFADGITEEQADELLLDDVAVAEDAVARLVAVPLDSNQFSALVSFTYNEGEENLAESTLLRLLNVGDYAAVPDQMKRWVYAGGEIWPGLVARREAEAALWAAI